MFGVEGIGLLAKRKYGLVFFYLNCVVLSLSTVAYLSMRAAPNWVALLIQLGSIPYFHRRRHEFWWGGLTDKIVAGSGVVGMTAMVAVLLGLPSLSPDTDSSYGEQAIRAALEGDVEEAERLFSLSEPATPDYHAASGAIKLAKEEVQQALKDYEKALELDPDHAWSLFLMARAEATNKRFAAAESLLQRSLDIRKKTLGDEHPEVAVTLQNLAMVYLQQGKTEEAKSLLEKVLAIDEKEQNPHRLAVTLNSIAATYLMAKEYSEAEPLLRRSLSLLESIVDPNRPHVGPAEELVSVLGNLGFLYYKQEKYKEAKVQLERSLALAEQMFGPDHLRVAEVIENLVTLLRETGEDAKADLLEERLRKIKEQ